MQVHIEPETPLNDDRLPSSSLPRADLDLDRTSKAAHCGQLATTLLIVGGFLLAPSSSERSSMEQVEDERATSRGGPNLKVLMYGKLCESCRSSQLSCTLSSRLRSVAVMPCPLNDIVTISITIDYSLRSQLIKSSGVYTSKIPREWRLEYEIVRKAHRSCMTSCSKNWGDSRNVSDSSNVMRRTISGCRTDDKTRRTLRYAV